MRHQDRDVVQPLAQRRQVDRVHDQAEVEILAEAAGLDLAARDRGASRTRCARRPGSLASRRRGASSSLAACAAGWPASERLISPISSSKSVPPCARSKQPRPHARRAGEGAALVAEQLGLLQGRRDGGAVDRPRTGRGGAGRRCGWRAPRAPCPCRSRRTGTPRRRCSSTRSTWRASSRIEGLVPTIEPSTLRSLSSFWRRSHARDQRSPLAGSLSRRAAGGRDRRAWSSSRRRRRASRPRRTRRRAVRSRRWSAARRSAAQVLDDLEAAGVAEARGRRTRRSAARRRPRARRGPSRTRRRGSPPAPTTLASGGARSDRPRPARRPRWGSVLR